MVEARGNTAQVPLADERRLVSGTLEELGEGRLRAVEGGADGVVGVAVGVGVLARDHAGAAGAAERVGHEALREAHAVGGDAVEVGRRGVATIVAAHHLGRVVVGHDIEDVHRLRGARSAGASRGGGSSQAAQQEKSVGSHGSEIFVRAATCGRQTKIAHRPEIRNLSGEMFCRRAGNR